MILLPVSCVWAVSLPAALPTEILNTYPWLDDFEKNLKLGSRKTIFSKPGIHLDIHNFEVNLGQLIIDAYHGKRSLEETIWRAQLLMEEIEKGRN